MKCTIPEISWHNREPVLSVDIHPVSNDYYKLASSGGDSHILIWQMIVSENGSVKQELVSDLTRHQRSVNTVRWSSTGQYLASADDDANIIVWQLKTDNIPMLDGNNEDKEVWIVHKVLRGHKEDIYDLCWSVDDLKLLSGSVDNTAIIWDLAKGKLEQILSDHKGFVQGVAWDPKNQLLATISTDRVFRIFDITGKQVKARIHKGKLPVSSDHFLYDKESKYFHDDTFKSFFRRLQFTPDGSLLIVPSGHFQSDDCKRVLNCTLIFTMDNWTEPAAVLPLEKQSSTVVRCCPLLFQHRDEGPDPLVDLPYRIIFAVGTDHDIILYDTQQSKPFARFHEIHYTRITDLTWSRDGLLLIASSTDGFCSLITFEPEELGQEYIKEESDDETNILDVSVEANEKDENVDTTNKVVKDEVKKRPSFILQWAQNTPKKTKIEKKDLSDAIKEVIEIKDDKPSEKINVLIPKRKTPQKVVENKSNTDANEIKDEIKSKLGEKPKEVKIVINRLASRRITPTKIGECTKKNTKAQLIEVRRKPREPQTTKENPVAKTIEVKETPNLQPLLEETKDTNKSKNELRQTDKTTLNREKDNLIVEEKLTVEDNLNRVEDIIVLDEDSQNSKSKKLENKEKEKEEDLNTKQTGVLPNTTDTFKEEEKQKIPNTKKSAKLDPKSKKTDDSKTLNTPPKASTSKQTNSLGKKNDLPKIKVGALAKQKLNTTPVKTNPLLEFLKKSGEKKKKTKIEPKIKDNIDLTLEEEAAMDGFNKNVNQKDKIASNSNHDIVPIDEDCTEDFCLQLEDTQDEEIKGKKSCEEGTEVDEIKEDAINRVIEVSDSNGSPKQKKPRRVPLITLASPKGKKNIAKE